MTVFKTHKQTLKYMAKTFKNAFFDVFATFFNVCYVLKKSENGIDTDAVRTQ